MQLIFLAISMNVRCYLFWRFCSNNTSRCSNNISLCSNNTNLSLCCCDSAFVGQTRWPFFWLFARSITRDVLIGGTVRRRKFAWVGHVTRHDSLSQKPPLKGTLKGGRRRGWHRKCWMDNIKECPCQNCSQGPPAGKTGGGSLLNRLLCSPTTQSVNWLNRLAEAVGVFGSPEASGMRGL